MFICTARSTHLLSALSAIEPYSIDRIISVLPLDKNTTDPSIQGFLITSDDVSSRSVFKKFKTAMESKNPENIVIFIEKNKKKSILPEGMPGVNYHFTLPTQEVLSKAVSEIISRSNIKEALGESKPTQSSSVNFDSVSPTKQIEEIQSDPEVEKISFSDEIKVDTTEATDASEPLVATEVVTEEDEIKRTVDAFPDVKTVDINSKLLARLGKAISTSEINEILENVTVSQMIKDITEENSTFAQVSDRLESLSLAIFNIMADTTSGATEEDKLRQVRGIVYDRTSVNAYRTTLIESYVHQMLDTVIKSSIKYVTTETEKINNSIKTANVGDGGITALEALKANRGNAVIMLETFIAELVEIENKVTSLTNDTISMLLEKEGDLTGSANINNDLKKQYACIVGENTIDSIKKLNEELIKMPDQFKQLVDMVRATRALLNKLYEADAALINTYDTIIARLTLDGVSQSQISKVFADKTVRTWVGDSGSGITILPYLFSRVYEKENCNILNIYIGDDFNLDAYGIKYQDLGTLINEVPDGGFKVYAGQLNDIILMDDIMTVIEKVTPYYRVINVITHNNIERLMMLSNKSLAVYVVQHPAVSNPGDPIRIFEIFKDQHALKFVVVNSGNKVAPEYFSSMGLEHATDVTCVKFPIMEDILNASIRNQDPYEYSIVRQTTSDLRRYV